MSAAALSWTAQAAEPTALVPRDAAAQFTCLSRGRVACIDARHALDEADAAGEARVAARRQRAAARGVPRHERRLLAAEAQLRREAAGDAVTLRRRLGHAGRHLAVA